ncbi:MAG: alpha/beta hydrolase [Acidimicrobiales bacterium]
MLSAPATSCTVHRKRERVATCGICGNALCVDCVVHTAVGIKCRKCTGGAAATPPTATPEAKVAEGDEGAGHDRRRWPVPVALLGVLAVLVAGFALLKGGDDGSTTAASGGSEENAAAVTDRLADFQGAGGLKLGATLTIPKGVGATKAPGVVIVPGGATVDRNMLTTPTRQNDPLYEDLTKSLAEAGIVSLRYDMRGTGASKLATGEGKSFEDLVVDARAGLDFLAQRRETQGAPLGLVAYDAGGFVAMSLAAADPRVKGVVLLSTPGRPLVDVLAEDFIRAAPDAAQGQALAEAVRGAAAEVVATGQVPREEALPPSLRSVFPATEAAYLRGLFSFDPVGEARRVQVPTLVVRGGYDTSITDVDLINLTSNLARGDQMLVPLGTNTLTLPPGEEGALHDPSRHGMVRNPDALADINEWIKTRLRA